MVDAIKRVVIPAAPRGRRGAARAPPAAPAPAPAAMPIVAVNQAALAARLGAAPAAQASVLPDVPFQQAEPPLVQATTFDVSDQTHTGWELNGMCADHHFAPRTQRVRTHPMVSEIINRFGKLTEFPDDERMRGRAVRVGRKIIDSPHHLLVVIAAGRILRQEEFRARTIAYLEVAMNIDDPNNLVVPTTTFFRDVRERAHTSYEEAIRNGQQVDPPVRAKYAFGESDTCYLTQFWVCRCEKGNEYFYANLHGPVIWQTVGYDNCGDDEVRLCFNTHVRDFFPRALSLTRQREYVQHVLGKVKPSHVWPPMPPQLSVDLSKGLWTHTVVFMDQWAADNLSRGLRRDITCIGLAGAPSAAWEKLRNYFFTYAVQRIVIFYGAVALFEGYDEADVVLFYNKTAQLLSENFGRARAYFVCPPYMLTMHTGWDYVVMQTMLEDQELQALAVMVSYPLDRRLWSYYSSEASDDLPAEARLEQDEQARLTDFGVVNRKTDAVVTHGLNLWSGLTAEDEPSQEELLQIAQMRIYEVPHQFGNPTVNIPDYRERLKPKKKEAPPSQKQAPAKGEPAPKRHAEQQDHGSRSASAAKRGKGPSGNQARQPNPKPVWSGSQTSVRSDQSKNTSGSDQSTMLCPDPNSFRTFFATQQGQDLLKEIIANAKQDEAPRPPPAFHLPAPRGPTVAFAAKTQFERKSRSLSRRGRAYSPWPSEDKNLPYSEPSHGFVTEHYMVISDIDDAGRDNHGHLERGCVEDVYDVRKRPFQYDCHALFRLVHHHAADHLCRVRLRRIDRHVDRHLFGDVRSRAYCAQDFSPRSALDRHPTVAAVRAEEAEAQP